MERSLPRNESSTGAKVPRSECSTERKFHGSESSLCGLFAPGNESAEERKGLDSNHDIGRNLLEMAKFLVHNVGAVVIDVVVDVSDS